jgi:hypothetical protein
MIVVQTLDDYRRSNRDLGLCAELLETRLDWLVAPVICTRDAETLDESNWTAQESILDEAGVDYETHRFGHWACGYYELHLVHPDGLATVTEIVCALADYPILDESDFSEREHEALMSYLEHQGGVLDWLEIALRDAGYVHSARQVAEDILDLPDAEAIEAYLIEHWHVWGGESNMHTCIDYPDIPESYLESLVARALAEEQTE